MEERSAARAEERRDALRRRRRDMVSKRLKRGETSDVTTYLVSC